MSRHVVGIDIDPGMLAVTRAKLAAGGVTNCDLIEGDAYAIAELVRMQVHFVFMANTFHGVPDKPRLARAVAAILTPGGYFAVVNWHRRPREETTVLGKPRGPKTELRMEPPETAATITGSDFTLARVVDLPPYHYGAMFRRI